MRAFFTPKRIWLGLAVLCGGLALGCMVYIGSEAILYFTHRNMTGKVDDLFQKAQSEYPAETFSPATIEQVPPSAALLPTPLSTPAPVDMTEQERLLQAEEKGRIKYADLLSVNPDYRGMLTIEGLGLRLPYVQGQDNDKYLDINFEGRTSKLGTVFMSAYNDPYLLDHNTIVFGHDTGNDTMFGLLSKYRDIKNARKASTIVLDSLTGSTVWLVFAAYICEPDYGYVDPNVEGESFADLLEEIQERSLYITNVDVNENDRILTLSTCANYAFNDARLAVHARLIREGEEIREYTVEKNPNPKPANVPKKSKMSSILASQGAAVKRPRFPREYIYQPSSTGIDWYANVSGSVQGPYPAYEATLAKDSSVAALYASNGKARVWLAIDRLNNKPGIYLLTSTSANSTFALSGNKAVTPAGVDARKPMLAMEGDTLWLCYSVNSEGQESLYRINLTGNGKPELILSRADGTGIQPMGLIWRDGHPLLFWMEKSSKQMYCRWLEEGIDHSLGTTDADRIMLYGDELTTNDPKMMVEKGRSVTLGKFDMSRVPAYKGPQAPTYTSEQPTVTPAPADTTPIPEAAPTTVPETTAAPETTTAPPELPAAPNQGVAA